MNGTALKPETTLAIFLGASAYPRSPNLADGSAFYNSAFDLKKYCTDTVQGLGLHKSNINWLFDDSRSPSDQLEDIGGFLERSKSVVQDIFIYYVGHGLFTRGDRSYCLAVRSTNASNEGATSIRASDLAQVLKEQIPFVRRFIVLDCCFSAVIYKEFQAGPLQAASQQLAEDLPEKGTALLCSSSAGDVSLAPNSGQYTMFSGALLEVLRNGYSDLGPLLSFAEVGDLVRLQLKKTHPDDWVRPELHIPDQRRGNISTLPIFPNPSSKVASGRQQEPALPNIVIPDDPPRKVAPPVPPSPKEVVLPVLPTPSKLELSVSPSPSKKVGKKNFFIVSFIQFLLYGEETDSQKRKFVIGDWFSSELIKPTLWIVVIFIFILFLMFAASR